MAWIESHQALADHPKTKRLARLLGSSTFEAVGVLHYLWWWTLDYAEDGDLSRYTDEDIADGIHWPNDAGQLVAALIGAGFLTEARAINDWDEYAGRITERRRQSRERQRRYRERDGSPSTSNVSVTSRNGNENVTRDKRVSDGPTNSTNSTNQPTVPTGERARAQSAGADPPKAAPVKAIPTTTERSAPKPSRAAEFIDAVKALDPNAPVAISDRDGAAIKRSTAKPERLAQAYVAAFHGDWGDDWLRDNLSVHLVVDRYAGFETHLRAPPKPRNGQTAVTTGDDVEAARRRYATTLAGGPGG